MTVSPPRGLRRLGVLAALVLSAAAVTGACGSPVGNNGKPVGMKRADSRFVIVVPLCPGERISSLNVVGGGFNWDVSTPLNPRATEFALGDNSAFRYVRENTVPAGGGNDVSRSDEVLVSVSTSFDTNQRYRFQNGFRLSSVGADLNGGREFDGRTVGRLELQKASNC
jgi:hypothetical protein